MYWRQWSVELDETKVAQGILKMLMNGFESICYKFLANMGPFGSLTNGVNQRIADKLWSHRVLDSRYCLSMFLSENHDRFHVDQDILAKVSVAPLITPVSSWH